MDVNIAVKALFAGHDLLLYGTHRYDDAFIDSMSHD